MKIDRHFEVLETSVSSSDGPSVALGTSIPQLGHDKAIARVRLGLGARWVHFIQRSLSEIWHFQVYSGIFRHFEVLKSL